MTTLKQLTAAGGLVSAEPVKKHIAFELDGQQIEADIHVRQIGIGEYETIYVDDDKNPRAKNAKERRSRTAAVIAAAITLGDDGKEPITFDEAYRMKPALAGALLAAFNEVNGGKKASPPATDSSATSA